MNYNTLKEVRRILIEDKSVLDTFWNHSDNIGLLIQVVCDVSGIELSRVLYASDSEFIQCNWKKIFDSWFLLRRWDISYDLECIIVQLFTQFTYDELLQINNATNYEYPYEAYMMYLDGVLCEVTA